jgi:hypothetical protein
LFALTFNFYVLQFHVVSATLTPAINATLCFREFHRCCLTVARDESRYYAHVAAWKKTAASNHLARVMHLRHQQAKGVELVSAWMVRNFSVIKVPPNTAVQDTVGMFRVAASCGPRWIYGMAICRCERSAMK